MSQDELFGKNNADSRYTIDKHNHNDGVWVESNFGKYAWQKIKSDASGASYLGLSIPTAKFLIVKILIATIILIISSKTFYFQIIQGAKYKEWADTNRIRQIPITAERGIIYDRNRKPLTENVPDFYLALNPLDLPAESEKKSELIAQISQNLGILPIEIEERIAAFSSYNYQSILIKNGLSYEQAVKLEILSRAYSAIQVKTGIARRYNAPQSMSHILGFLRQVDKDDLKKNPNYFPTDDVGKDGIELQYESALRGSYGRKQIEVDALGRQTSILAKEDPISGNDIVLTIDIELQKKVEEILKKHMRAGGIKRAAAIISDVVNGEILAMVSLPSYDNNIFSGNLSPEDYNRLASDASKPLWNRTISGEYPSGSVIKPIFAAAALEQELINEKTAFLSTGGIKVDKWFFPDWKLGGHGLTNVRKALAESVNTFFYIISGGLLQDDLKNYKITGLGAEKLKEYAQKFGLAAKLGIDLPGETTGFLPDPFWKEKIKKEMWYIGDTYHMAIGQGDLLVTPLQANSWTATLANGGTVYRPHLVKTLIRQNGGVTVIGPQILNKNFIQSKNLEIIRQGLRDCVLYGSCNRLGDLNFSVAGKTGTAQWGKNKKPHAWFTGFAPYENPDVAITILMEEGGEGSAAAIPAAKEILWWYFNVLKR